jgi:hypothetical protein
MFLDYFALGILVFVAVTLFYAIIAIHDVPYEIAKHRNQDIQDSGQQVDGADGRARRMSSWMNHVFLEH